MTPNLQRMSGADFAAWVTSMKKDRGWSARECSRRLGAGVNQIARWQSAGAPPYIALACAALSYGLPPWRAP